MLKCVKRDFGHIWRYASGIGVLAKKGISNAELRDFFAFDYTIKDTSQGSHSHTGVAKLSRDDTIGMIIMQLFISFWREVWSIFEILGE